MNYFELHIGDLTEATAHLSMLEDGAYGRLMRKYYATEKPLPADITQVQRLVAARSKEERAAVEAVLREFFDLQDDGWHQSRCDAEIATFREKQVGAEGKRENAKERQRRARERRAALFDELRGHNIVPPWTTTTIELEAMLSRVTSTGESQPVTQPVTRDDTATQTPDTILQSPDSNLQTPDTKGVSRVARKRASPPPVRPENVAVQVWDDWLELRAKKRAPVTATVLEGASVEAAKAGMTLEAFLRVWCSRGSQGLQADWLRPEGQKPNGRAAPAAAIDTAARNAEAKRLLGFDHREIIDV